MRTSLIISTYNRADALHLVLRTVAHQLRMPDEVIIADDGSRDDTRDVIDAFRDTNAIPVLHAWQEDRGFRLARVRNLALSMATGDYVIFVDGDMLLHPAFVGSHIRMARRGYYLQGRRAMLSHRRTAAVLSKGVLQISPFASGIALRKHAFHIGILSRWMSHTSENWHKSLGANMSFWMDDIVAANGFNEDFEGWGREDSEFVIRLKHLGVRKMELRYCATAFHLAHGNNNRETYREATGVNQKILEHTIGTGLVRCINGLDRHGRPVAVPETEYGVSPKEP